MIGMKQFQRERVQVDGISFNVIGAVYIGQGADIASTLDEEGELAYIERCIARQRGSWVLWHVSGDQVPKFEANDYRQHVGVNLADGTTGYEMSKRLDTEQ